MTSPTPGERDPARFNSAIRQLYKGGSNNTGTVTLRANQITTVVNHQSCNPNSHISVMPLTASALRAFIATPRLYGFTRVLSAVSGNVAYTGMGFKPVLLSFLVGISGGNPGSSNGVSDGIANTCLEVVNGSGTFYQGGLAGIQRQVAAGGDFQSFTVASMDADGFTLAWTKNGVPTFTASIMATAYPETGVRVISRTTGSFTLGHSAKTDVDQTLTYSITGGA